MDNALERYIHDVIDTEYIFEDQYDDESSDLKKALGDLLDKLPSLQSTQLDSLLNFVTGDAILKVNKKDASIIFVSKILTISAKVLKYQLFQHENNLWIHNSKKWMLIDTQLLKEFIKNASSKMGISHYISASVGFVNKLQKQIMQDAYFELTIPTDKHYINVNNGIISITKRGIDLISHNPKLFLTHCLDIEYNSSKKSEEIKFLNKITPSIDVQKSLQQSIAQILIKDYSNGKKISMYNLDNEILDRFINTIKEVVPKDIVTIYFNHSDAELDDMFIDSQEIKNDPYLLENLTVIPCEQLTAEELDNINQNQINKVDIFYWLIDGAKEIIKNRQIYISKDCDDIKNRFNTVKLFVEEYNFIKTPKDSKSIISTYEDVFKQYTSHCELQDEVALSKTKFNRELKALGYESTRRGSGNVWFAKFA